jgi:hypothetical protein
MDIFIKEEIIKETTNCLKGFSCLSGKGKDLCRVLACFDDDIHFILCQNDEFCSYQKKVSERVYCDCPVRKEIFKSYNI